MEAGLRRPDRDAEHLGDPRERQVEVEVQDDDGPGLRLESGEDPVELVAVGDPRRRSSSVGGRGAGSARPRSRVAGACG